MIVTQTSIVTKYKHVLSCSGIDKYKVHKKLKNRKWSVRVFICNLIYNKANDKEPIIAKLFLRLVAKCATEMFSLMRIKKI